jgi:hypothetical protein
MKISHRYSVRTCPKCGHGLSGPFGVHIIVGHDDGSPPVMVVSNLDGEVKGTGRFPPELALRPGQFATMSILGGADGTLMGWDGEYRDRKRAMNAARRRSQGGAGVAMVYYVVLGHDPAHGHAQAAVYLGGEKVA